MFKMTSPRSPRQRKATKYDENIRMLIALACYTSDTWFYVMRNYMRSRKIDPDDLLTPVDGYVIAAIYTFHPKLEVKGVHTPFKKRLRVALDAMSSHEYDDDAREVIFHEDELQPILQKMVSSFMNLFETPKFVRRTTRPTTWYRGIRPHEGEVLNLRKVFNHELPVTSFATDIDYSLREDFVSQRNHCCLLVCKIPSGTPYLDVDRLILGKTNFIHNSEREVIIPSGFSLRRVMDRGSVAGGVDRRMKDIMSIYCELIPP